MWLPLLTAVVGAVVVIVMSLIFASTWTARVLRRTALGVVLVVAAFAVLRLYDGAQDPLAIVGVLAGTVAALALAAQWRPNLTIVPAVALASTTGVALAANRGVHLDGQVLIASILVATAAWGSTLAGDHRRRVLAGALPVAGITALALTTDLFQTMRRIVAVLERTEPLPEVELVAAGTAVAAGIAAMAIPEARRHAAWVLVPVVAIATATIAPTIAWVIVLVVAAANLMVGDRPGAAAPATLMYATLAVAWSGATNETLSVAALTAAILSYFVALEDEEFKTLSLGVAPAFAAVGAGYGGLLAGFDVNVNVGISAVVAIACALAAARLGFDRDLSVAPVVVGLVTVVTPLMAANTAAAGTYLIIAGAGWTGLQILGLARAAWVGGIASSLGVGLILADAGVTVVEAYVALPATVAMVIGLWWLAEHPQERTMRALGPGLGVALIPSYLALLDDPSHMTRTVALVLATVVLGFVGVTAKWFAPMAAMASTAVVIALAQLTVSDTIIPRWVAFAAIGGLLLWAAATYERLKELR